MGSPARQTAPSAPPPEWTDAASCERVRQALLERRQHTEPPGDTEWVRTHISAVLLTPRFAFKFKRPVELGFADFSTLALRERYCRAEVELNRRLAPGVYLDVLPLTQAGNGYALDGAGPVVDWCVVMHRLEARHMLDARLRAGDVTPEELDKLARLLADFHRGAEHNARITRLGGPAAVVGNWEENFRQTEAFVGTALTAEQDRALRQGVRAWLERNAEMLEARAAAGHVRDGHGDLRCEHVDLGPPIRIIDCIEFNERFRYADVANDLAFLLMDLVAQGHEDSARELLQRYVAHSGDRELQRLVPFYACYRAYVRGKVTAFKLNDPDLVGERRRAVTDRAQQFFRLACRFLPAMEPPVLVLVGGLMGTGKTSLAQALAQQAGIATYNSDALRKELPDAQNRAGAESAWGSGPYGPEQTARTYEALLERADLELAAGRSVILDASFAQAIHRDAAFALAKRHCARAVLVECRLDEAQTRERLRRRTAAGGSVSDGREELLEVQRAAFEPVRGLPTEAHLVVDTSGDAETLAAELLPRLRVPPLPFGRDT